MNKPGASQLAPLQKADLETAIAEGASISKLCSLFERSSPTIRYWLKKHGLKTLSKARIKKVEKHCRLCDKPDTKKWLCMGCQTRVRRYRTKLRAVELLGGQCQRCGWKGPLGGYDFHHIDGKDFTIGSAANKSWALIENELKKCELLCRNCHGIEHSKQDDPRLAAVLALYDKFK